MDEAELNEIERLDMQAILRCHDKFLIDRIVARLLVTEVRRLREENERLKTRWAYIVGRHIRCGSLHMDGTGSYSMVGAIGVGRSSEEAVDNAAVLHGFLAAAKPQE